jgi:DNA segregation ATPase FtsK/SpoIIIE-like protein
MTSITFDIPPYDPNDELDQEGPIQDVSQAPDIPINFTPPTHQTISLRMPQELLDHVDALAAREDTSRSHMMRRITSFVVDAIRNDPDSMDEYGQVAAHLYDKARELVFREMPPSVSLLQRHFRLDYHMALLLMDELERTGVVLPPDEEGRRKTKLEHLMALAKANSIAPDPSAGCWMDRKL